METFTHAEDNQNDIFPKVKEGSETDVEIDVERKGSLWESFHLSLNIAAHAFCVHILKNGHGSCGSCGNTRSVQKGLLRAYQSLINHHIDKN